MKIKWRKRTGWLALLCCVILSAGCQKTSGDVPQISKEVADAMKEDADAEPLKEINEIPENGIVSAAQMKTIAGKEGTYYFNGKTEGGITYQWAYDGTKIQNPVQQNLKVDVTDEGLDEIKKSANDAPYGLGVILQDMEMAAPATLTITLTEQWDADKVLYCTFENGMLYQMDEATIQTVEGEKSSQISFRVNKAGGTYYLLGGSTEGTQGAAEPETGDEKSASDGKSEPTGTLNQQSEDGKENTSSSKSAKKDTEKKEEGHFCTISIECSTILDHWDDLKESKAEFVPSDGWILYASEVEFTPGDTVFDVLKSVCRETDIHMASRYTPLYGSYYIEGINQIYEFDCGPNSGWMYSVDGWYPNYGCSEYEVEDGDKIAWKYTCNLGSDVGNGYKGGDD